MPRNEIKMRRQMISADQIQRYRNYPALMKQFKRSNRMKLAIRIFIYSLLITVFILLLIIMVAYIMTRWENKQGSEKYGRNKITSIFITDDHTVASNDEITLHFRRNH